MTISQVNKLLANQQFESAIELCNKLIETNFDNFEAYVSLGDIFRAKSEPKLAYDAYQKALEINPSDRETLIKFAKLELPGPHYLQALAAFHQRLLPKYYVEIGVSKGNSLRLVSETTKAIGIDPQPQVTNSDFPDPHKVITMASDDYFDSQQIVNEFDHQPFDLAFIDGMHLFEYALRDFVYLERYSSPQSVVLIHDVFPINEITSRRERLSEFWSGDIWKLIVCLKEYRPDLEIITLPCPPTGLSVVKNLDPNSKILTNKMEKICNKYLNLSYSIISNSKATSLNLVSATHPLIC